ncbi:MAG: hypothetical protein Q9183_001162 [Haloplaca sp. 2 TL-2023]
MAKGRGGARGRASRGRGNINRVQSTSNHFVAQKHQISNSYGIGNTPTAFSLQDEARNTESGRLWASNRKLRHSHVNFVSAGGSVPQDPAEPNKSQSMSLNDGGQQPQPPQASLATLSVEDGILDETKQQEVDLKGIYYGRNMPEGRGESRVDDGDFPENPLLSMDTTRSTIEHGIDNVRQKTTSAPSISSGSEEEVIVFMGRRKTRTRASRKYKPPKPRSHGDDQASFQGSIESDTPAFSDDAFHAVEPDMLAQNITSQPLTGSDRQGIRNLGRNSLDPKYLTTPGPYEHQRGRGTSKTIAGLQAQEDQILADYIANMSDKGDTPINASEGSPDLSELRIDTTDDINKENHEDADGTTEDVINELLQDGLDWNSTDLHDLDEMSTSAEACLDVSKVLATRVRSSCKQYLVIGEGQSTDDARWIPASSLGYPRAQDCIRQFELQLSEYSPIVTSSADTNEEDDDVQAAADLQDDIDDLEDERDLLERKQARMTDERIAQILSKQEELGLGSGELLLFDGEDNEDEGDLPTSWSRKSAPTANAPKAARRSRRGQRGGGNKHHFGFDFPSATLFADVLEQDPYGGFDVMDQERPSLRKKQKGRRGGPVFDLSDNELEVSLQMAWEKDRSKKKLRKEEREELRAQGLLGRQNDGDVRFKHLEGISFNNVKDELMDFLLSRRQSLAFPPMAHKDRKMIHEMGNLLRLKSKSSGNGKNRFPVLYKTSRTGNFDEGAFNKMESLLASRRFLPRKNGKGSQKAAGAKSSRAGGGAVAGVSYMDGEIVGAAAPEIGVENRGRAMLEKMGWSKGTALGALNNKGMLQPVTHVVKTTKAGLG